MSGARPLYICETCGHDKHLHAIAMGFTSGRLVDGGTAVTEDSGWDQAEVESGSIECQKHLGDRVLELREGAYCWWQTCEKCDGRGVLRDGYSREFGCTACARRGGEWVHVLDPQPSEGGPR